jgi:beta-lactamase regulating signal transducer with metallopeptidase domain
MLALAWFLAVDALASGIVAVTTAKMPRSASALLTLRLLPAAIALTFVGLLFVPSYWRFEPRELVESMDVTLAALAGVAVALIVAAAIRGIGAWRAVSGRARSWLKDAEPIEVPHGVTAYRIRAAHPLLALVGIVRPRLVVSDRLVDALSDEELAAGAAHEIAHLRARDNLKRLAMRAAPDAFWWTASARRLERAWAAAAEYDADAAASRDDRGVRLALAAALVKAARLMPRPEPAGPPVCTLVGGGDITSRVERLIDDRALARRHAVPRWALAALVIAAAAAVTSYWPIVRTVHAATEILVHVLP